MLEFFHPPNINQQSELMQGHPENISTTMPCHERTGKLHREREREREKETHKQQTMRNMSFLSEILLDMQSKQEIVGSIFLDAIQSSIISLDCIECEI